jgi:two-component system NtrC family sensor kinase
MERLAGRLRTLSRPDQRPRHVLDVRAPRVDALECVQAALDEKRIVLSVTLGERSSFVLGDDAELEELFLNLLVNAHEATPPGGTITVEVRATDTSAAVSIGDSGPGIPAELIERIFDPFFTTKKQGSGLGLAICAGIAQSHLARLRATNSTGGGAVFLVEFPVTAPSAATVPA